MAYDVTSEWDDIHRKLGNYEPLPQEKKQEEFIKENIDKLEQLGQQDKEDSDFDSDDEDFYAEYKRKQLEKFGQLKQEKQDNVQGKFGYVRQITKQDYILEVNKAGDGVPVLLNFFQEYNEKSVMINNAFKELAIKYPNIKFLKTIATQCVENFPDSSLPYILYYKDGQLVNPISKVVLSLYPKLTTYALEHCLNEIGIEGIKFQQKSKTQAKDFYNEIMNKNIKKNEIDSDEEEREDKQFISNKVYLKY